MPSNRKDIDCYEIIYIPERTAKYVITTNKTFFALDRPGEVRLIMVKAYVAPGFEIWNVCWH